MLPQKILAKKVANASGMKEVGSITYDLYEELDEDGVLVARYIDDAIIVDNESVCLYEYMAGSLMYQIGEWDTLKQILQSKIVKIEIGEYFKEVICGCYYELGDTYFPTKDENIKELFYHGEPTTTFLCHGGMYDDDEGYVLHLSEFIKHFLTQLDNGEMYESSITFTGYN